CSGTSTTFSVLNAPTGTTYSWTFTSGSPSTSTSASPTVTYNTPGTYAVTLTVSNGGNNNTITKTSYITVVSSGTAVSLPVAEGFVSTTFPPTNWTITNTGATTTWGRAT